MDVNAVKIVDNNPIFLLFPINPSTAFNLFHHISLFANNNNNQSANSSSHFQVYRKPYIPDHFHYQNNYKIAPIILVADLGWVFVDRREKVRI